MALGRCMYCSAWLPLDGALGVRAEIHHDHKKGPIALDNGFVTCHYCHQNIVHGNRKLKFRGGKE